MATQSVPQVVPFPKPTEAIPQTKLEEIISLRRSIRELETRLDTAEKDVKASLEAGAFPEKGLLRAFRKVSERRSVAWKQVVERELGETYAKRVLAATKPDQFTHYGCLCLTGPLRPGASVPGHLFHKEERYEQSL